MKYGSTRGTIKNISFSQAVQMGIASDGGLFVPLNNVRFDSVNLAELSTMSYDNLAKEIIKKYASDFSDNQITQCVNDAYCKGNFPKENPAPVTKLNDTLSVLELWHGPTCAFKDMALQILPKFMVNSLRMSGNTNEIVILTATSGDTGKAALEGFKDVEGIRVIVFYPENGVSEMQKTQMVTQEGNNVSVVAVNGNFDDTQTEVKKIFGDKEFAEKLNDKGFELSSANSINWGRLLPQIIYYYHAYFSLVSKSEIELGDKVNFVVPTGNFGDILACYYAMLTGLPVNKIICASNDNNILTDFFKTGVYDSRRDFMTTISPAMDILISSNLERLLYDISGNDDKYVSDLMKQLKQEGIYSVDKKILTKLSSIFWASYAKESETMDTIHNIFKDYNYLIDPHTAVGINVYDKYVISTGDMTKTIAVSTASPFKFNKSVAIAVLGPTEVEGMTEFEMLDVLADNTGMEIPEPLRTLNSKKILHTRVCEKDEMKQVVSDILSL